MATNAKLNIPELLKNPSEQQILVIGAGISGLAAAEYLLTRGAIVTLADNKTEVELLPKLSRLIELGVKLHCGSMPESVEAFEMAIVSPGLPLDVPIVSKLQAAGIPIVGELELAYLCSHNPFLAITGTNGKTTTTSLLGHIIKAAGKECLIGGNIGLPLITAVDKLAPSAVIVAEVSSFQLETAECFHPVAAAFLNLTPDHLNRHHTMENYGAIKAKIFANQTAADTAVLNYDDAFVRALAPSIKANILYFSRQHKVKNGFYAVDDMIYLVTDGTEKAFLKIEEIFIKGGHNVENVMAACAMALAAGIDIDVIKAAVRDFRGVAHRQEYVREKDGVLYINDSKGTNPDSTLRALEAYDRPMVLILGATISRLVLKI